MCAGWFSGLVSVRSKRLDGRALVFPVVDGWAPGRLRHFPVGPSCDVLPGLFARCRLVGQPVVEGRAGDLERLRACVPRDVISIDESLQKLGTLHAWSLFMNLNHRASEIVTGVHEGARYARGMADPEDDRGEALAWYFRMLIRQELERGVKQVELAERLGVGKGHISQIQKGTLGIGTQKLIAFSEALGHKPGELLDKALAWWPVYGKKERAKALAEAAAKASAALEKSEEQPPKSGPKDSDRPGRKRAG